MSQKCKPSWLYTKEFFPVWVKPNLLRVEAALISHEYFQNVWFSLKLIEKSFINCENDGIIENWNNKVFNWKGKI